MNITKLIYYIFLGFLAVVALFLIFSALPVTGNYKFLVVQSGSMEPAIKMGSVIMIKPSPDYKVGDIVTFGSLSRNATPNTHRIYDIEAVEGQSSFITKGDANEEPDPRRILKKDILGKVWLSFPYLGYAVNFAKKPLGFGLIVVVPALVVISDEIKNIFNEIKKNKKKNS